MSNNQQLEKVTFTFQEMEVLAHAFAASGLFGLKTKEQAFALMAIAQAEGLHPAIAATQYDIISGKPTLKAEAILSRFLNAGGKVEWHEYADEKVSGTFSHPQGGIVKIDWDMQRAKNAGLAGKDNWKKWPRNMLRARVISEGVRTVYPGSTNNFYTKDEVEEFREEPNLRQSQVQQPVAQISRPKEKSEIIDVKKEEISYGKSPEDRKLIYQKALQIAETNYGIKSEDIVKDICRSVLLINPPTSEQTIDEDLCKLFYDYVVKNKGQ